MFTAPPVPLPALDLPVPTVPVWDAAAKLNPSGRPTHAQRWLAGTVEDSDPGLSSKFIAYTCQGWTRCLASLPQFTHLF